MSKLKFLNPHNQLEKGGIMTAPTYEEKNEIEINCPNCHKDMPLTRLNTSLFTCACGFHFKMNSRQRIETIFDKESFSEFVLDIDKMDPLHFPGYSEKIERLHKETKEKDAVVSGVATIDGVPCCIFVMEPNFMMGSMGSIVGEEITYLFEYATENKMPVIGYTVSGGARMQEGLVSLMQMAKTSAAVKRHSNAGNLYIAVLTNPTTGGVTASFAMEADIILAEPGATVGFAGARVISQTTKKPLPNGFQTAEFVLEHGFIDAIVERKDQKSILAKLLKMHNKVNVQ